MSFFLFLGDAPFTSGDFIDKLFPNLWSLLINLLALVVLFAALYFIAYKPVKKFVKARKDYIEGNIKETEKGKKEMEKALRKKETIILDAREEGDRIIASSKADAEKRAEMIIGEANAEAASIRKEAKESIEREKKKAESEMRKAIVMAASEAARKALEGHVDEKEDERIRSSIRKEIGDE